MLRSVLWFLLKNVFPWILVVGVGFGGYVGGIEAADSFSAESTANLGAFFTADSAVLAGLLIALALGAAIADRASPLAPLIFGVVCCLTVALAASLVGLAPGLSECWIRHLFALAVAGSAVSAVGVLLVAYAAVHSTAAQRKGVWTGRLRQTGILGKEDTDLGG